MIDVNFLVSFFLDQFITIARSLNFLSSNHLVRDFCSSRCSGFSSNGRRFDDLTCRIHVDHLLTRIGHDCDSVDSAIRNTTTTLGGEVILVCFIPDDWTTCGSVVNWISSAFASATKHTLAAATAIKRVTFFIVLFFAVEPPASAIVPT